MEAPRQSISFVLRGSPINGQKCTGMLPVSGDQPAGGGSLTLRASAWSVCRPVAILFGTRWALLRNACRPLVSQADQIRFRMKRSTNPDPLQNEGGENAARGRLSPPISLPKRFVHRRGQSGNQQKPPCGSPLARGVFRGVAPAGPVGDCCWRLYAACLKPRPSAPPVPAKRRTSLCQ